MLSCTGFFQECQSIDFTLGGIPLVSSQSEQVEPDLTSSILLDSSLDFLLSPLKPVLFSDRSVRNRSGLEPIKLIELTFEREVGDKVEDIVILGGLAGDLDLKGILSGEGVVRVLHFLKVPDGQAFLLGSKLKSFRVEGRQVVSYLDVLLLVEQNRKDGLGGAGVVDHLVREEELFVEVFQHVLLLAVALVLEQEDQAVDGSESGRL